MQASGNVAGLCNWAEAMCTYHNVAKVVEPKIEALRAAEAQLKIATREKDAALEQLVVVQTKLDAMQASCTCIVTCSIAPSFRSLALESDSRWLSLTMCPLFGMYTCGAEACRMSLWQPCARRQKGTALQVQRLAKRHPACNWPQCNRRPHCRGEIASRCLQAEFDAAMRQKQQLEDDAAATKKKMEGANALLGALAGEETRWTEQSQAFDDRIQRLTGVSRSHPPSVCGALSIFVAIYTITSVGPFTASQSCNQYPAEALSGHFVITHERLVESHTLVICDDIGDCVIASSFVSYLGPFIKEMREHLNNILIGSCQKLAIPHSKDLHLTQFLTSDREVGEWTVQVILPA